jgi:formylglycine-generating enzyme required for sulfatase activity
MPGEGVMTKVFVSYRREDSEGVAGRIHDHLCARFGDDAIFMDIDRIPFGVDFREYIDGAVSQCAVLLAVIGPGWLGKTGESRRIDNPGDWVRLEIEAALKRGIPVIPVLIGRVGMPGEAELPSTLGALAYRNAINVDPGRDFRIHVERLIRGIEFHIHTLSAAISGRSAEDGAAAREPQPSPGSPVKELSNSLGMTLLRIEPGSFLTGSTKEQIEHLIRLFPDSKPEWFNAEQPQHRVEITRPFFLGVHQVTVGQFRRFVERSGYQTESEKDGKGSYAWDQSKNAWELDPSKSWRSPGFEQTGEHPVVCVSHNDAAAFCGWLSKKEERITYRLPLEAEWEFACRAGTITLYPTGDDPENLMSAANVADAALKRAFPTLVCIKGDDGFVYTSPVGSFAPNAWGLYDVIGNVWEWCADWYDGSYYGSSPPVDPRGPSSASGRVLRGGSWSNSPWYCRPAYRNRHSPGLPHSYLGFRVAAVRG